MASRRHNKNPTQSPITHCRRCVYFDTGGEESPTNDTRGECRREAPGMHLLAEIAGVPHYRAVWPTILGSGWCGAGRKRSAD